MSDADYTAYLARLDRLLERLRGCGRLAEAQTILDEELPSLLPVAGGLLTVCDRNGQHRTLVHWGRHPAEGIPVTPPPRTPSAAWQTHGGVSVSSSDDDLCLRLELHADDANRSQGGMLSLLLSERDPMVMVLARPVAHCLDLALTNLRLREDLYERAIRDPLTNLYNRRYLQEALVRESRRAERRSIPLALMLVEVDHFQQTLGRHGRQMGDQVLCEVGNLLRRQIRAEDMASRLSGETFALLLPETYLDTAANRSEDLCEQARHLMVSGRQRRPLPVTLSIGVAILPIHAEDADALMRAAEHALIQAKGGGRNRVVVTD